MSVRWPGFIPSPARRVLDWAWTQRVRLMKFGVVGVSGTAVNLVVLWASLKWLLPDVEPASLRLNLGIALGILFGLTNNFILNSNWTWRDRHAGRKVRTHIRYLQYAAANWAGILTTVVGTNILARWVPDLVANASAIAVASVVNFTINDLWTFRHVRTEGIDPERGRLLRARISVALVAGSLVLATVTYLHGLSAGTVLRNGDEMVYAQIVRETAATGQWLPLQSGMDDMRNTKPPLLFWQGMVSTDWGGWWSLIALRLPSIAWTFGTAVMAGLLAWRIRDRDVKAGVAAAVAYLAFFSTYRYGRPFLTNPPETFWFFGAFFAMLWWRPWTFRSRIAAPLAIGAIVGMALLYKSFAQLAPIGFALAWWHMRECRWDWRAFLRQGVPSLAIVCAVSLGMFSLWFALDPDPASVWREFVVGENLGKMGARQGSWIGTALWGSSSVWSLALGWLLNAGLLAFPVFGVAAECIIHRRSLVSEERLLWILVISVFLVFCLPSQRSPRYLLEAMPAVAVILATRGHHVGRNAFVLTLLASAGVIAAVAWLSLSVARGFDEPLLSWSHWLIMAACGTFCVAAIVRPSWSRACAAPAALATMLCVSTFLGIFKAPHGTFDLAAVESISGRTVWVPENFRSVAEEYRFLLPGVRVRGYPASADGPPASELGAGDFRVVALEVSEPAPAGAVASRMEITSRHSSEQLMDMARGDVVRHLFRREWIVPVAR